MGFFSFTCAKTHLPILASTSWPDEYARVTVLTKDGSRYNGTYDGYGRIFGSDGAVHEVFFEGIEKGNVKLVLTKFYANDPFEKLDKSYDDPGQGHFHDEDLIKKWHAKNGFSTLKAYLKAYKAVGHVLQASVSLARRYPRRVFRHIGLMEVSRKAWAK